MTTCNSAATSTSAETKTYDCVIWRDVSPEEALCAVLRGEKSLPVPKISTLPQSTIEACQGKRVLVCGSYYDQASIKSLCETASEVVFFFYSKEEQGKYGDILPSQIEPSLLDTATIEKYPWSAKVQKGAAGLSDSKYPEEEALYRGIIHEFDSHGWNLYEGFTKMREGTLPSTEELINIGHIISKQQAVEAAKNVEVSGKFITFGGYTACLVFCSVIPAMPPAVAAAKKADIGINMRYNVKTNTTSFTCFTSDPTRVNLKFIEDKETYNGGGRPNCKGITVVGKLLPVPDKDMSEIFPKKAVVSA